MFHSAIKYKTVRGYVVWNKKYMLVKKNKLNSSGIEPRASRIDCKPSINETMATNVAFNERTRGRDSKRAVSLIF